MASIVATLPPVSAFISEFTPGAMLLAYMAAIVTFHYWKSWREDKKLSQDDRQAKREGFARQTEILMRQIGDLNAENRLLRADLLQNEQTHSEYRRQCQAETEQLRNEIVGMQQQMAGVLRKAADIAVRAARGDMDRDIASAVLQLATEAGAADRT